MTDSQAAFKAELLRTVPEATVDTAVAYAERDKGPLTDALHTLGVHPTLISAALLSTVGATFTDNPDQPEPNALKLLDPELMRELNSIPIQHNPLTNTTAILTNQVLTPKHRAVLEQQLRGSLRFTQTITPVLSRILNEVAPLTTSTKSETPEEQADTPLTGELPSSVPAHLLGKELAEKYHVVPLREEGPVLILGVPSNLSANTIEELRFLLKRPVRAERHPPHEITNLLNSAYADATPARREEATAAGEAPALTEEDAVDTTAMRIVSDTMRHALTNNASDIHIDPHPGGITIRIRKDGVLTEHMKLPASRARNIVARVKVLAGMNIADSLKAQDGRIRLREKDIEADMRVATHPTIHGEKVTMRLLQKDDRIPELEQLDMSEDTFERFNRLTSLNQGVILITGPTGSGKSTTLFSYLKRVHRPELNTMTIEDPVEYELPGLNQVQVNAKAGITFANSLRNFVRHDPDIILVGEIRDRETAQIATEAALTGHLVISTVHTNNAPSTITRLLEMNIPPYLISDSVRAILAQRLVRRLCSNCKQPTQPKRALLSLLNLENDPRTWYTAPGCPACLHTGYDGRLAIHELMILTPEQQRLINATAPAHTIMSAARAEGMLLLREDAINKAAQGHTSLEEVLRHTSDDEDTQTTSPASSPEQGNRIPEVIS